MLDRTGAESPGPAPVVLPARAGRQRRRALVACALLALALHAVFIGGVGGPDPGSSSTGSPAPVLLRTLPDEPAAAVAEEAPGAAVPVDAPPPPLPPTPRPPRRPREPRVAASQPAFGVKEEASADLHAEPRPGTSTASQPLPGAAVDAAVGAAAAEPAASAPSEVGDAPVDGAASGTSSTPPPLLAAGEQPPPLYRTQLPPSVTLHYQVRRGFLRGTGEIRWQASGDRYRLVLDARIAGLTLLTQTSEGAVDAHGLAPERFLDQRARRSAQAANFRRDDGRITFSGSGVEWPLLAGSQDRLSWMIQLAGIAAAEPERLVEGGRITMVVVGARGDAGLWTLRFAGRETIETAGGTVHAVKLVREGRSAYDTSAEIWLDPERSYLPAHATLRNSGGASEYDLLLERIDPG